MNEIAFWTRVKELELLDESMKVKHLPRKEWPSDMLKNKNLFWQVPRNTAQLLFMLATIKQPRIVLELGTSAGYSALWIAHALQNSYSKIHTIEFSDHRFEIAKETFRKVDCTDMIVQYHSKIESVLQSWSLPVDFLFIDANKPGYTANIKYIEPFLTKGALVVADNILDDKEKMQPFIDYMQSNDKFTTKILNMDNGVLVAVRK